MTAEIAVLNKLAVALAADSAVTVGPGRKIFNSAEKLFQLLPGRPLGLMIYNASEFMELPWETILNRYRQSFLAEPREFATLQEYAEHFLAFLRAGGHGLFADWQQERAFGKAIDGLLAEIARRIEQDLETAYKSRRGMTEAEVEATVKETARTLIARMEAVWAVLPDRYAEDETREFFDCLLAKYGSIIDKVRDAYLGKLPLSDEDKEKIRATCLYLFSKDRLLSNYSGLVFAGFGTSDLFPGCFEYAVENLLCKRLKFNKRGEFTMPADGTAGIYPFAQGDIVENFVFGRHTSYAAKLKERLVQLLDDGAVQRLLQILPDLNNEDKIRLEAGIRELKTSEIDSLFDSVEKDVRAEYTASIMETVVALPKDELAIMAETLVSITSFMRHVSMVAESVGGPVDVAIISRKDGFVWVKRKHYFDRQLNPDFHNM